jgi:hypothetical protein
MENVIWVEPVGLTAVANLIYRLQSDSNAVIELSPGDLSPLAPIDPNVSIHSVLTIIKNQKKVGESVDVTNLVDPVERELKKEIAFVRVEEKEAYIRKIAKDLGFDDDDGDVDYFITRVLNPYSSEIKK